MREPEMEKIGAWIVNALKNSGNKEYLRGLKKEVEEVCVKFPVPGLS